MRNIASDVFRGNLPWPPRR